SETRDRRIGRKPWGKKSPPTWPPESHWRKSFYATELGTKGSKTGRHLKPRYNDPSGLTGLVVGEGL
ncbi:9592_t:CDS:1, partial [Ambispora leptoticha]